MPKTETNVWTERKRRVRAKESGRVYDRARSRALAQLARSHPDEYQKLLEKFRRSERRRQREREKAAAKDEAAA